MDVFVFIISRFEQYGERDNPIYVHVWLTLPICQDNDV